MQGPTVNWYTGSLSDWVIEWLHWSHILYMWTHEHWFIVLSSSIHSTCAVHSTDTAYVCAVHVHRNPYQHYCTILWMLLGSTTSTSCTTTTRLVTGERADARASHRTHESVNSVVLIWHGLSTVMSQDGLVHRTVHVRCFIPYLYGCSTGKV